MITERNRRMGHLLRHSLLWLLFFGVGLAAALVVAAELRPPAASGAGGGAAQSEEQSKDAGELVLVFIGSPNCAPSPKSSTGRAYTTPTRAATANSVCPQTEIVRHPPVE